MIISKGADVLAKDRGKMGTVDRVVVDPQSKEVTHIVVGEDPFFASGHVVSTQDIESTTEGEIVLRKTKDELRDSLPDFEETHFVELREGNLPFDQVDALYWYPPVGGWWTTGYIMGYSMPQDLLKADRNIPDDKVPLQKGTQIVTDDGEKTGRIKRVITEKERITYIVIKEGVLFPEEQFIPTQWIKEILESEVILSVEKEALETISDREDRLKAM